MDEVIRGCSDLPWFSRLVEDGGLLDGWMDG